MAELQTIKRRLRSVSNTRQITKAMQLVAASKLRRAQAAAAGPASYVSCINELVDRLAIAAEARRHPFCQPPANASALAIVITADRGLAGAYNYNVFRQLGQLARQTEGSLSVITVGRRGTHHLARADDLNEIAAYSMDGLDVDTGLAQPILQEAIDSFTSGHVGRVYLLTTHFQSTSVQIVEQTQLLPYVSSHTDATPDVPNTEPDDATMFATALTHLLEAKLYQAIVEARAAEQAARMLAMKNATDNAADLIEDLTLARNNARQSTITQELAEISGGAEAVNNS